MRRGNNESLNMKTTLKITTLLLAAALPCAALAAIAGFAEPAAFNRDLVFPLCAIAGLQLMVMTDGRRRPTIDLSATPAMEAGAARPSPRCALRHECATA